MQGLFRFLFFFIYFLFSPSFSCVIYSSLSPHNKFSEYLSIYLSIYYIYIYYIYIYICNSSKSTFCTKRSRVQHWRKVYCHWTTPKHKAKQRKHHRILKERENVWIKKLETLHLKGLVDIKKSQIEYSQRNI